MGQHVKKSPKQDKYTSKFKALKQMKKIYNRKSNSRGGISNNVIRMNYGGDQNFGRMTKDNFGSEQANPFLFAEGYG